MTLNNKVSSAFIAVSKSYSNVSRFLPGLEDRDMYLSYASQVPDTSSYGQVSYWMAGGFAARLQRINLAKNLIAPGQNWLSEVSENDPSLTARSILTTTVDQIPTGQLLFAKPAEAKIESIPAGKYFGEDLLEIFRNNQIPLDTLFQWTETLLPINHEHRFFIADSIIYAGSPYLIDGVVYHSAIESSYYFEAERAAEIFVQVLKDSDLLPPALTLDVGRNEDSGEWLIVEANPAWSSGPYGAAPSGILKVLERACNWDSKVDDEKWLWKPAEYLVNLALIEPAMELIPLLEITEASGVFKYM